MTLFPIRSALILVATTALCSAAAPAWAQMPRPNFPIRQEAPAGEAQPTAAQERAPVREEPPMPAQPEPEGVTSRPLDTPAMRRDPPPPATTTAFAPPKEELAEARTTPPRRSSRPAPKPVVEKPPEGASGKVVASEGGGETYKVRKGDNLAGIARKLGVDIEDLAKANGLRKPYRLMPGQELKGPRSSSKAYVIGKGDTLYAIARRFSTTPKEIADANNMSVSRPLTAGKSLILPEGFKDTAGRARVAEEAAEPEAPAPKAKSKRGRAEPEATAPEPAERDTGSSVRSSVTGKVISVTGRPMSYKVRKGDNLDAISRRLDMDLKDLAKANKLKSPYHLKPGQILKGPPQQEKAYVPVEGDTLSLIARRFGVTAKALAAANGMKSTAAVRPGKHLILPDGYRDRGPIRETVREPARPAPSAPYNPPPQRPEPQRPEPERPQPAPYTPPPYTPPQAPPAYTPPPAPVRPATPAPSATPSGPLADSQISTLGRGRFQWPMRGDVISTFGPKGTGQRNDGINIRAAAGDVVRAAAAGDVVYAGDQVPGFGNLVLVKHADGWVTAYGHLGRVDVKMQQKVVQGQQLGMAGQTGGVSEPQLHFEVRYAPSPTERARPVDPQLVLGK